MKKLMAALVFALSSVAFAQYADGMTDWIKPFLSGGKYIEFHQDKDNVRFVSRDYVSEITVDEDDVKFVLVWADFYSDLSKSAAVFTSLSIDKYNFSLDEENNLVITPVEKQKKKK